MDSMHRESQSEEGALTTCILCLCLACKRESDLWWAPHDCIQFQMKWESCRAFYEKLIPKKLPNFNKYAIVAGFGKETQKLLIRILDLVPKELKADSKTQPILDYIEDGKELPYDFSSSSHATDSVMQSIYYLLAHYYYVNREYKNAEKYYILDLSLNPDRFDSWAVLGVVRSPYMGRILSEGGQDTMSTSEFFGAASEAIRCYKKALQLDPKCTTLWIEYGNLAYYVGSQASRLRKMALFSSSISQVPDLTLMAEDEILQAKQTEMLRISKFCFESAINAVNKKHVWLVHRMLGKISEKSDPLQAIKRYQVSDLYLYLEHPSPIYEEEAVEIHYRMHAAVLKHLTNGQKVSLQFLRKVKSSLLQALRSPFVNNQEYNPAEGIEEDEDEDEDEYRPRKFQETDSQREASVSELMYDMVDLVSDEGKNSQEAIEDLKQEIITMCLVAMKRCVARFPGHYKALFRLAHYFHTITRNEIAKALLLNPAREGQIQEGQINNESIFSIGSLSGIFAKRTSTNLFNAILAIRVNGSDPTDSFERHMFRCTLLLIQVAGSTGDYDQLASIALQLSKKPDGDEYLRDKDRLFLAKLSFESCVTLIKKQISALHRIPLLLRKQLQRGILEIAERFLEKNEVAQESQEYMEDLRGLMNLK